MGKGKSDVRTEKAIPEQLAEEVLEYCEAAGYTLDEVLRVGNRIGNSVRHICWDNVVKNMPYRKKDEGEIAHQKI